MTTTITIIIVFIIWLWYFHLLSFSLLPIYLGGASTTCTTPANEPESVVRKFLIKEVKTPNTNVSTNMCQSKPNTVPLEIIYTPTANKPYTNALLIFIHDNDKIPFDKLIHLTD